MGHTVRDLQCPCVTAPHYTFHVSKITVTVWAPAVKLTPHVWKGRNKIKILCQAFWTVTDGGNSSFVTQDHKSFSFTPVHTIYLLTVSVLQLTNGTAHHQLNSITVDINLSHFLQLHVQTTLWSSSSWPLAHKCIHITVVQNCMSTGMQSHPHKFFTFYCHSLVLWKSIFWRWYSFWWSVLYS
jgi:hypothetical protein